MTIRRGARRNGFTVLDNAVFNAGLSFRAIGLLTYLLSKPDHWEVSVQQLVNISSGTLRPDGRDSIYSIIDELMQKGFIRRERKRDNGRMNGYDYEVHDVPQRELPSPKTPLPETVAPETPLPSTAETTQVKTDLEVKTEQAVTTELPAASQPPAVKVVAEPVDEKETALQSACRATWAAYGEAYAALYGAPPLRNAAVNAKIKQFVQRIGYEESPEVARFYVERVRERLVSQRFHDVGLLLSGAEGYRTQWYTNTTMTGTRAQQIDKTQSNADAADEALAILMARRRERSEGGETWR